MATNSTLALGEEREEPGESETIARMLAMTEAGLKGLYPPGVRPFRRDAHPKMHGLVRAEFRVLPDLPEDYRYGLFATPQTYLAWIRFSGATGPIRSDADPDGHGMAVKLLGVGGEKVLPAEKDATTLDFLMVNYPTFLTSDVTEFLSCIGPDKAAFVGGRPDLLARLDAIQNQHVANPLQLRYWSMTPYKLGPRAMKFSARRVDSPLDAKPAQPSNLYLRDAMIAELQARDVDFDFLIQLQRDAMVMPIEDASVLWDEAHSPFVRVASIHIPKQSFDSEVQTEYGENLSFTPWHALPEQRPLGGINRARKSIYTAISKLRHEMNDVPREEPTALQVF